MTGEAAAIKKDENVAPIGSALAIRAEQEAFSRAQVEALRKMYGWDRVPQAELSVFFHQAQRTGLDPFARQIYLIGRRNNRANRTDYTIQTSIDGMRLVADRTGRYAGSDRPKFGEDHGDKYAEVTVYKIVGGTRVPFTGVAYEVEFRQDRSPMWQKMPRTMLAKCAEAQALRKAFPADLSGIYGSEEMDQAGRPVNTPEELGAEVDEEGKPLAGQVLATETGEPPAAVPRRSEPRNEDPEVVEGEVVEEPAASATSGDILKSQIARIENLSEWIWHDKRKVEEKVLKGHLIEELDQDGAKSVISGLQKMKKEIQEHERSAGSQRSYDDGSIAEAAETEPAEPGTIRDEQYERLVAVLEELFPDEDDEGVSGSGARRYEKEYLAQPIPTLTEARAAEILGWAEEQLRKKRAGAKEQKPKGQLPATKKQLNFLEALIVDVSDEGIAKFEEMTGKAMQDLTRDEASEWIERLRGRAS